MATSMVHPRESRQSVQLFDVDLFRNKLENFMRKQADELAQVTNTKKRKLSDRFSEDDDSNDILIKEDLDELAADFDSPFGGKRQRTDSYYPIDDDELEHEEISPLALPSPATAFDVNNEHSLPWPDNKGAASDYMDDNLAMAMRRKLSGYSEASAAPSDNDGDDSWMSMSSCPPLSRASYSSANSMPHTPRHMADEEDDDDDADANNHETYMADVDIEQSDVLHAASSQDLELDLGSMAPHERTLLAALAPERFEKAALIKKAFKQPDQLFGQFVRENHEVQRQEEMQLQDEEDMVMDDGEYRQVFDELMTV